MSTCFQTHIEIFSLTIHIQLVNELTEAKKIMQPNT